MEKKNDFKPFISADKVLPEFTVTSVILGMILAVIFCGCLFLTSPRPPDGHPYRISPFSCKKKKNNNYQTKMNNEARVTWCVHIVLGSVNH